MELGIRRKNMEMKIYLSLREDINKGQKEFEGKTSKVVQKFNMK